MVIVMPINLTLGMPQGVEISSALIKEAADELKSAGQELFKFFDRRGLELRFELNDEGTIVPLSEAGPFLAELGLPADIFDRQVIVTLTDNRKQLHQFVCFITSLKIFRRLQIQLFTDCTEHFATSGQKTYSLVHLSHNLPTELGGPEFYVPNSWLAQMENLRLGSEASWEAQITFH